MISPNVTENASNEINATGKRRTGRNNPDVMSHSTSNTVNILFISCLVLVLAVQNFDISIYDFPNCTSFEFVSKE